MLVISLRPHRFFGEMKPRGVVYEIYDPRKLRLFLKTGKVCKQALRCGQTGPVDTALVVDPGDEDGQVHGKAVEEPKRRGRKPGITKKTVTAYPDTDTDSISLQSDSAETLGESDTNVDPEQ